MMTLVAILLYPVVLFLLTTGGNLICRIALKRSGVPSAPDSDASKAGRMIGNVERILIMVGLVAQSWEVLIAVIALKTVARHKELDEQTKAEYFLIGSLVSVLWAVIVTLAAIMIDKYFAFDIATSMHRALSTSG